MAVVLSASDSKWDFYLDKIPGKDIYFTAAYHRSFETSMKRSARLFVHEAGGEVFFYPFMIAEIPGSEYSDIETVYGYSGAISTTGESAFLKEAYDCFYNYALEQKIVCEMQRFHPLLANQNIKGEKTELVFNRHTVSINLEADLLPSYHPKLRNDLLRAEKMGLEFSNSDISVFKEFYLQTMKRLNAADFYIFADEHFEYCRQHAQIFAVSEGGKPIACAVFMISGEMAHYHLAASADSPNQAYASKLLIHKAAEWAKAKSCKQLHLGGGRTTKEDDSLLFFKKRFASTTHDFFIGKTIFDRHGYDKLCNEWKEKSNYDPGSFLQLYRLPLKREA